MIKKLILKCSLLICLGVPSGAQLWTGVIPSTQAVNWASAGTTAAHSSHSSGYTLCATLAPGTTSTIINSTLAGCARGTYVQLQAGTYTIGMISWSNSGVALRGAGADQTFLVSTPGNCNGLTVAICIHGPNVGVGSNPSFVSWTAGYAQGSQTITVSSSTGINTIPSSGTTIPTAGTLLFLDQCDDGTTGSPCAGTVTDNSNFYACSTLFNGTSGCGNEVPSNAYRPLRSQMQAVWATSIAGNNLTLVDPISAPQWRSGQTPQAWLYPNAVVGSGVENLSVNAGGGDGILCFGCADSWITGNRIFNVQKRNIWVTAAAHMDIQSNYSYGPAPANDPYCFDPNYTSFVRFENNISQACRSHVVFEGPSTGTVIAYNYFTNDFTNNTTVSDTIWEHSATSMYSLYEGNILTSFVFDDIHGSHNMNTVYRSYHQGWSPGKIGNLHALAIAAYSRYMHIIGNVLGTPGQNTTYQIIGAAGNVIYDLGYGVSPVDQRVPQTVMRWGNWDSATNAVRWCGNSSNTGWATTCASTSEIPTGDAFYPVPLPTSGDTLGALPTSLYLSGKPFWWGTQPFPPIGPEITSGTLFGSTGTTTWAALSTGGHANDIPALDCFKNIMGGPADGSGGVLTYNQATCFNSVGISPTVLGPWTSGEVISQLFSCSGCGAGSWSSAGVFPTGLSFNSATGTLSGTIGGTAGTFTPSVSFSTSTNNYSIVVNDAAGISTNSPLPSAIQGQSYTPGGTTETLTITNGTGISTCAITAGSLIGSSLTLNSNCTITGTAGNPGLYSFTITPTDANGVAGSPKAFQLNVLSSNLVGGSKVEGHMVMGGAVVSH